MKRETFDSVMSLQTQKLALELWLANHRQVAYTGDEIYELEAVIMMESKLEAVMEKMVAELSMLKNDELNEFQNGSHGFTYTRKQQMADIESSINQTMDVDELIEKYAGTLA